MFFLASNPLHFKKTVCDGKLEKSDENGSDLIYPRDLCVKQASFVTGISVGRIIRVVSTENIQVVVAEAYDVTLEILSGRNFSTSEILNYPFKQKIKKIKKSNSTESSKKSN